MLPRLSIALRNPSPASQSVVSLSGVGVGIGIVMSASGPGTAIKSLSFVSSSVLTEYGQILRYQTLKLFIICEWYN